VSDGAEKKFIVADKQKILRDGLMSLLGCVESLKAVGEAKDGGELVQRVEQLRPDLVLMDLSFPGRSGVSAAKEIKKRFPQTKILVLTTYDSEDCIRAALQAGADGYCLKETGLEELVLAIESVLEGKIYLSPAISDKIIDGYLRPHKPAKVDLLTHREKQIFELLGEGHNNKAIADLLSISVKTVEKHKSNIRRKLDCRAASDLDASTMLALSSSAKGHL
jgi:DNA-binding NarL/FixJ family response regulator